MYVARVYDRECSGEPYCSIVDERRWNRRSLPNRALLGQSSFVFLNETPIVRPVWSKKAGLDEDLLEHWLERTGGASALQYLFMGQAGTRRPPTDHRILVGV